MSTNKALSIWKKVFGFNFQNLKLWEPGQMSIVTWYYESGTKSHSPKSHRQNPTGQNPTGHNPTMGIVDKIPQQ